MNEHSKNELTKLAITKDSFLYSVNQAYEARIQPNGQFKSHLIFEPFLEKVWELPQTPDIHSFKRTLAEIVAHHFEKIPYYRKGEAVNLENISWFSHSMAALFADIEYLLLSYTGYGLPLLFSPSIPRTNSSKNIFLAIQKYLNFRSDKNMEEKFNLLPLLNENNEAIDELYVQEVWSLIFYNIKKVFGSYTQMMSLYATWKYLKKVELTDIVDWNLRPPCGDLYRKQFKHLFERDYSRGNGNGKFSKNNQQSQNKADAPESRVENPQRSVGVKERPNHQKERPEKREYKSKPRRSPEEYQKDQEIIIETALQEASEAVLKMKKNESLEEFLLKPQNSFIRRQQHVVISEGGFETESRGEGEERCVCLKRK